MNVPEGLGQPQEPQEEQVKPNPYVTYNEALKQRTMRLNGQAAQRDAQIEMIGAQKGKIQAETNIMQGLQAMSEQQRMAEMQAQAPHNSGNLIRLGDVPYN